MSDSSEPSTTARGNASASAAAGRRAYVLVSYSLSGLPNLTKIQVSRRVNGYRSKKYVKGLVGGVREYTYPGLKDEPDVIHVAESALLLPKNDLATGFMEFLRRKLVTYTSREVWLQ